MHEANSTCLKVFNDHARIILADLLHADDFLVALHLNLLAVLDLNGRLILLIVFHLVRSVEVNDLVTVGQDDDAVDEVKHLVRGALDQTL